MLGPDQIPGVLGGFGAANGLIGAITTNRAVASQQQSQIQATVAQQNLVVQQAQVEKLKRSNESAKIIGAARVSAGERGVDLGGSTENIIQQAAVDEEINSQIISSNAQSQIVAVRSRGQANLASLESQRRSPLVDGFLGGITGLTAGLRIEEALNELGKDKPPKPPSASSF